MTDPQTLAAALIEAHRTGARLDAPVLPLSRDEALWVQAAVMADLGPVAGFKVARVAGGAPILAPIPACHRLADGGTHRVRDRVGVELEVGFELIAPLPAGDLPTDLAAFFRPCAVLELVDTRLSGPAADDPAMKLADLQVNAGLVVGGALSDWDGSDFGTVTGALRVGDQVVLDGPATVPGGSALANLALLVANVGDHCGGLQPGQVVITGSLCGLPRFGPGHAVKGQIAGLGRVALALA